MMREFDRVVSDSLELMTEEEMNECNSRILGLLVVLEAVLDNESAPSQE